MSKNLTIVYLYPQLLSLKEAYGTASSCVGKEKHMEGIRGHDIHYALKSYKLKFFE